MWTFISVSFALVINFYTPDIPKTNKLIKNYSSKNKITKSFPYQYFKGEILTDEMVEVRIRVIYISFMISIAVTCSVGPTVGQAITLGFPPQNPGITRLIYSDVNLSKQAIIDQVIQQMPAEIDFTQKEINQLYDLSMKCNNNSLNKEQLLTKINNLRGGSFVDVVQGLAIIATIIILSNNNVSGFQVNVPPHLQWLYKNNYQPGQAGYGKGSGSSGDCGTQLHAGSPSQSLKTWEDRNQPNVKDRWFLVESRPELIMHRGQSKFKTKSHGAVANLPYSIKKNGSTSTLKTEENVDGFMDATEEVVYNPNSAWFEKGTYQGGTDREIESINVYNEKHNRIAVFKRSTGEFITFCEPTPSELEDLMDTGNFGGKDGWFSGKPKNLPPKQEFISDFTTGNSFENDVLGISPISSMDESSSPNQEFTQLKSFESDVLGITPVDNDWQI